MKWKNTIYRLLVSQEWVSWNCLFGIQVLWKGKKKERILYYFFLEKGVHFFTSFNLLYECNTCFRLTVGMDNCLFHFQYYDNLEGVFISSEADVGGASKLNEDIYKSFQTACQKIKHVFDNARKIKVNFYSTLFVLISNFVYLYCMFSLFGQY